VYKPKIGKIIKFKRSLFFSKYVHVQMMNYITNVILTTDFKSDDKVYNMYYKTNNKYPLYININKVYGYTFDISKI
jgi:hypothetical protein